MQLSFPWDKKPSGKSDESIAFKDPDALTAEEERKLKLEIGTNWRPRTSTKAGEGYQFFQVAMTPLLALTHPPPHLRCGRRLTTHSRGSGGQLE